MSMTCSTFCHHCSSLALCAHALSIKAESSAPASWLWLHSNDKETRQRLSFQYFNHAQEAKEPKQRQSGHWQQLAMARDASSSNHTQ